MPVALQLERGRQCLLGKEETNGCVSREPEALRAEIRLILRRAGHSDRKDNLVAEGADHVDDAVRCALKPFLALVGHRLPGCLLVFREVQGRLGRSCRFRGASAQINPLPLGSFQQRCDAVGHLDVKRPKSALNDVEQGVEFLALGREPVGGRGREHLDQDLRRGAAIIPVELVEAAQETTRELRHADIGLAIGPHQRVFQRLLHVDGELQRRLDREILRQEGVGLCRLQADLRARRVGVERVSRLVEHCHSTQGVEDTGIELGRDGLDMRSIELGSSNREDRVFRNIRFGEAHREACEKLLGVAGDATAKAKPVKRLRKWDLPLVRGGRALKGGKWVWAENAHGPANCAQFTGAGDAEIVDGSRNAGGVQRCSLDPTVGGGARRDRHLTEQIDEFLAHCLALACHLSPHRIIAGAGAAFLLLLILCIRSCAHLRHVPFAKSEAPAR